MVITKENYPTIFFAFRHIDADNGRSVLDRFYVPTRHDPSIERIEVGLMKLTGEQLETFCTGETGDQETLVAQFNLSFEHSFLNEYFDNWDLPTDF